MSLVYWDMLCYFFLRFLPVLTENHLVTTVIGILCQSAIPITAAAATEIMAIWRGMESIDILLFPFNNLLSGMSAYVAVACTYRINGVKKEGWDISADSENAISNAA